MEAAKSLASALSEFTIRTALRLQSICKEMPAWFGMPVSPGTFMPVRHPHRHAPAIASRTRHRTTRRQDLVLVAAGLIAGAATHVVWDSFTHASGFAVQVLPGLQAPVLAIGARQMHAYNLIQHASTFIGVVALCVVYRRWLRSQQPLPAPASVALECMRYVVLAGCLACACAIGWLAVAASADSGSRSGPMDVFRMAILATDSLAGLLLLSAWAWRKQGDA